MRGYTIDEVLSWDVCYPREQLKELYAGRETLIALDCFDLPIPGKDKLYALLRPKVIPERELHLLACDFAERVAHLAKDPHVVEVIRVKRLWVEGEASDEELATARDAALNATEAAAPRAAEWAAGTSVRAAERMSRVAALDAAAAAWEAAAWEAADASWEAWKSAWLVSRVTGYPIAREAAMTAARQMWRAAVRSTEWADAEAKEQKAQLALVREVVERLDREEEE